MTPSDDQPTFEPGGSTQVVSPSAQFPYAINTRYRCIELIGHGSSGAVYRAYDEQLHRDVAIKFIHRENHDERSRLLAEGRALAQFDHPHICNVYEVVEENNTVYMVMSYINGRHLSEWRQQFSHAQLIEFAIQVSAALSKAHHKGIIHCDVKPANIVLQERPGESAQAVLVDFGVAHTTHSSAASGGGTKHYMAPERSTSAPAALHPAIDIYAMGATLRLLLTGSHEDSGLRRLPKDLRLIIKKCLQSDPALRYQDMQQLHSDLVAVRDTHPISLRRSLTYRLQRLWQRSSWFRWTSTGTFISAAALLLVAVLYQGHMHNRQMEEVQIRERVAHLENRIEAIHRSPIHDKAAEIDTLYSEALSWIEQAQSQPDWLAAANYAAAGRILLQLSRDEDAYKALLKAWQLGERSDTTAMALARIHTRLYMTAMAQAHNLSDPDARAQGVAKAHDNHRLPALAFFDEVSRTGLPRDYTRAMQLYLQGEESAAVRQLRHGRFPDWFYRHHELALRLLSRHMFDALTGRGEGDPDAILDALEYHAEAMYQWAPSRAQTYQRMARVYNELDIHRPQ
jgi:predicted Ser/Thr protein kinase